jgi:hypothetical protein
MVSNYRPISVLNSFSKIFEFIIYDHLYCFFKYRLNPSQHGFHKHNSTTTILVTYLNTAVPYVNTQGKTDSVYFDLSNAFDIVPHNLLLRKLTNFTVSCVYISWFHSCLTNRQSSVRISGTFSPSYVVKPGVPQGSTLGPLLFNIFVNDICDSTSNSKNLLLYADLKIYRNINYVHDCQLLQTDINFV